MATVIIQTDGGTTRLSLTGSGTVADAGALVDASGNNLGGAVIGHSVSKVDAIVIRNYGQSTLTISGVDVISGATSFRVNGLPTSYQLLLPSGHPDNPFTGYRAAAVFRMVGTDGGSENVNKAYRFLTGLKGTAGAFDWETGLLYNRTERNDLGHGYL